jgi:LPS-assembly lipoprotein
MLLSDARHESPMAVAYAQQARAKQPGMSWLGKLAAAAMLVSSPLLGGCGFTPMYATGPAGSVGTIEKLSQVDFPAIPSRVGQRLRNELIFQSTGGGEANQQPLYRFDVAIREFTASTMVNRTGDSAGQIYNLDAKYTLVRISDQKKLLEGVAYGRAAFERYTNIYANVRAKDDAENRAAKTVAVDLKNRLAAFLATN